jgi:glycogen phosphorylase
MRALQTFLNRPRIAYFSMEIALASEIPTYSGGLGVLAGDTLRSAADLGIPLVGVTLVSREGYFRQGIDADGRQVEQSDHWDPAQYAEPLPAKVRVPIGERDVWIGGWLYTVTGMTGARVPVVLLDTDLPENADEDRRISDHLYGGDLAYRFRQEIVLGIGGIRLLEALGFTVSAYHLNEGHSALLTLQLVRRCEYESEDLRPGEARYDLPRVRDLCHFTTHTPVEAGHDRFPYDLVDSLLDDFVDRQLLRQLAGAEEFNNTRLALNLSEYVNGVAKSHAETSRKMFPGYRVSAVTNGIHPHTWTAPSLARLYDETLPGWCLEPELLSRAEAVLPDDRLWQCHVDAKLELIRKIHDECGIELDPTLPLIGYARRMTLYKRPELFFADVERLRSIAARQSFQAVFAGKAHPQDAGGKHAIETLNRHIRELGHTIKMAFLPNYTMSTALALVSGCDVWLNTPKPPMEASGTSGMKAALNGVPNLSILDGWWAEGHLEGVTGWSIGDSDGDGIGTIDSDAKHLYDKLEQTVLPLFADRDGWLRVMKGAISRNGSLFHSHRMMRRYAAEAYLK